MLRISMPSKGSSQACLFPFSNNLVTLAQHYFAFFRSLQLNIIFELSGVYSGDITHHLCDLPSDFHVIVPSTEQKPPNPSPQ